MTCSVCGADTAASSVLCDSCDRIVGRGRHAGDGSGRYVPPSRPGAAGAADISPVAGFIWGTLLAGASAWSAHLIYGLESGPYSAGAQVGHVLGHVLIALLVAALLRWLAKARFWRTFLITWSVLVPLTLFSMLHDQQRQRMQGLHAAALSLSKALNTNPAAAASTPAVSAPVAAGNDAASALQIAFERAARNAVVFRQQEAQRLQAQRDLHLENVLTPARLVSAQGIAQSRRTLDAYRTLLTQHRAAMLAFEDQNRSYLMDMPAPARSTALAGFQRTRSSTDEAFARFFQIENSYVDTGEQLLDVAQRALGHSRLDANGKLVLPEPMHTQAMALVRTIHAKAAEEAAVQQHLQALRAQESAAMDNFVRQTSTP